MVHCTLQELPLTNQPLSGREVFLACPRSRTRAQGGIILVLRPGLDMRDKARETNKALIENMTVAFRTSELGNS